MASTLLAKQYQIELVIFEHIYNNSSPEAEARLELEPNYKILRQLSPTNKENLVLSDVARRIRGSRNFRYIGHASWIQEGLDQNNTGYVSLDGWLKNGIEGSAIVYVNRYLHLDILLNKENSHPMRQKRRMRSKEMHYIDHPNFGILAQITPVDDLPKQATSEAQ